jgi:hypothetical protein
MIELCSLAMIHITKQKRKTILSLQIPSLLVDKFPVSFFVSGKTIPEEPNTLPSIHSLPFIMGPSNNIAAFYCSIWTVLHPE